MSLTYHHGARNLEVQDAALTLKDVSTAVIGLIATASDADPLTFPLDTPVALTRARLGVAKAGVKGTLAKALETIADQVTCPVVVVRVPEGVDDAATTTNVIGGTNAEGRYTGMKALLSAEQRTGLRPRILGAPGLDTQPVTVALASLAKQLKAFAYATCADCHNIADAKTYRKAFGARELMLIWPDFTRWDTVKNIEAKALTIAVALGTRAKLDQQVGWHRVLSNVPVEGVTGISADVYFDYLSEGTDADILNEAGVTTLIMRNGLRFWGSRTCDDGAFVFESYTRTAQIVADTIAEGVFEYSDKPLHASLVRDIIESINAKLRHLTAQGALLGGKCWFDPAINDTATLKAGKLSLNYDYTPVPPMEDLTLRQTFTDVYFADLKTAITSTNNA
jgi:phage tail sheath protein FI